MTGSGGFTARQLVVAMVVTQGDLYRAEQVCVVARRDRRLVVVSPPTLFRSPKADYENHDNSTRGSAAWANMAIRRVVTSRSSSRQLFRRQPRCTRVDLPCRWSRRQTELRQSACVVALAAFNHFTSYRYSSFGRRLLPVVCSVP